MTYWFGGRVAQEGTPSVSMQVIVPDAIRSGWLFLGPQYGAKELSVVIHELASKCISIRDIRKIDYSRLQYFTGLDANLTRVRGHTVESSIGWVLSLNRAHLTEAVNHSLARANELQNSSLGHHFVTDSMYERVRRILVKSEFREKFDYSDSNKRGKDYESDDPDHYKSFDPSAMHASQSLYDVNVTFCFIHSALFRNGMLADSLAAIADHFEILGSRFVETKDDIYTTACPPRVRDLFRKVAYRFYYTEPHLRLKKKLMKAPMFLIALRSRAPEKILPKFYNFEKCLIETTNSFESKPRIVFMKDGV